MKKLTRKLLLSVFSLGLAVVTLSTTTFAWYTTNAEVSATGITGTSQGEVSGSLEISKDNANWGPTIDLEFNKTNIVPLQRDTVSGKLKELNATEAKTDGDGYIHFTIYVRNSKKVNEATPVYLKSLKIQNSGTITPKPVLVEKGGFGANTLGTPYAIDAVRALSLGFVEGTTVSPNYSLGTYLKNKSLVKTTSEAQFTESLNAIDYYNAVMHTTISKGTYAETEVAYVTEQPADATKSIIVATLDAEAPESSTNPGQGTSKAITFSIWLEGWDQYCFDVCQGQTFTVSFELTTDYKLCDIQTA